MTPAQCRAVRAALGWNMETLAKASDVGGSTITRFENGLAEPIQRTIEAIQDALEDAGVIFLANGERAAGGEGARMRK